MTDRNENPTALLSALRVKTPARATGNVSIRCPLPDHNDTNPSFSLDLSTGCFTCHGCGMSGGPEDLAVALTSSPEDAARYLIENGFGVSNRMADDIGRGYLAALRSEQESKGATPAVVAEYPYCNEDGEPLYRVRRWEPGRDGGRKSFTQERWEQDLKTWISGRGGVATVPFQLPALVGAVSSGKPVYIAEGEKDVLALMDAGCVATTNPGGAKAWVSGWGEKYFGGATITVIADRDDAGHGWAQSVASDLNGHASTIEIVQAAEGKDAADHLAAGLGIEAFDPADLDTSLEPIDEWPPLIPLDEPPLPPIPLDDLPAALRDHVKAVAESLQVSTDMVLMLDLATIATATQGQARVRVKADWTEETCLFVLVVAESGERKSAVAREASLPIREFEADLCARLRTAILVEQTVVDTAKKRLEKLKDQAAKAVSDEQRREAEVAIEEQARLLADKRPITEPRLLVDDITPQALGTQLSLHGSLGVLSAEGGLLETFAGRYEQQTPNIDLILKAYGGESARIDRVGRESEHLERPLISLGLAVQPDVLEKATSNRAFVGRGLIARFLLVTPESRLGYRAMDVAPIPAQVKDAWRVSVKRLAREPFDAVLESGNLYDLYASPKGDLSISLSPDSQTEFRGFQEQVEEGLRPDVGRYRGAQAAASKTPGLAVRIAANLHLLDRGPDGIRRPIEAPIMRIACKIAERSLNEHVRYFSRMDDPEVRRHAKAVLKWGRDQDGSPIPQARITNPIRGRGTGPKNAESLTAALALLEQHGLARQVETHTGHTGSWGHGKPNWEFRPQEAAS